MPVRSDREVEALELGMAELGDEHGRHAVERGAALGLDRLQGRQRIETLRRIDHGGAVGDAGEVAQHHAEAVIERHRDADLVLSVSRCASPMKKPLLRMLWWVSVAPLGAPVVPQVNWMLIGSSNCSCGASSATRARSASPPRARTSSKPRKPSLAPPMRMSVRRLGSRAACSSPGVAAGDLRRQLAQHADIVAGLEAVGGDQRLAAHLVERVFELGQPVGRVDVDHDQPGLGGGELGDHPFAVVGRPDADPVAGLQPQRDQPGGAGVDPFVQLGIAPAHVLMAHDQRRPVAEALHHLVEMHTDGVADQRHIGGAVRIALCQLGHDSISSRDTRRPVSFGADYFRPPRACQSLIGTVFPHTRAPGRGGRR